MVVAERIILPVLPVVVDTLGLGAAVFFSEPDVVALDLGAVAPFADAVDGVGDATDFLTAPVVLLLSGLDVETEGLGPVVVEPRAGAAFAVEDALGGGPGFDTGFAAGGAIDIRLADAAGAGTAAFAGLGGSEGTESALFSLGDVIEASFESPFEVAGAGSAAKGDAGSGADFFAAARAAVGLAGGFDLVGDRGGLADAFVVAVTGLAGDPLPPSTLGRVPPNFPELRICQAVTVQQRYVQAQRFSLWTLPYGRTTYPRLLSRQASRSRLL